MYMEITLEPTQSTDVFRLAELYPERAERLIVRTLNQTARAAERIIARQVTQVLNVRQRDLRRGTADYSLKRFKASRKDRDWAASVVVSGAPIPIADYTGSRQTRRGVSYRAIKASGRKKVKSAFILPSGVTKRRGKARYPLTAPLRVGSVVNVMDERAESFLSNVIAVELDKQFKESQRVILGGFI